MFTNLLTAAESANFRAAAKNGQLSCPSCGAKPITIPQAADDVIICPRCNVGGSGLEWANAGLERELAGDADRAPADTKISRHSDATGAAVWEIPASGKSGGLMFFAVVWGIITAVGSLAFLFGEPEAGSDFSYQWLLIPFGGIFWAVGLGMFYGACRNKYAKHRLSINRTTVTLRRELFGIKEMILPTDSVQSIAQVEFYQKNYQPVRGIEIKGSGGKLRFGSILTDEEKAWLVADIKRAVFGAPESTASAPRSDTQPSRTRQSHFSIPLPGMSAGKLAPGILLTVIGVAFVLIGIFVIDPVPSTPGEHAPGIFRIVEMFFSFMSGGFRMIWTLMSGFFAVVGLMLLASYFRTRSLETRLEASEAEVAIRARHSGHIVSERVFPRSSVIDIRASSSGTMNGKSMKRLELLAGGKAQSLARWMDGEQADALVAEARRALF